MEWLNYFIKKAFEKIGAENERRARLFSVGGRFE